MAGLLSSLFGGGKPTAMPTAQPMSPEAQYLQNMQRLSQGDVSSVLTGGDKLLALSALLGSVARGSRTTPQEVMAQVQQQAQSRIGSQMQLAQLQAKFEQDKRQKAFVQQFASTVPEAKRGVLENADPAEAFKLVQEEVFRPKQYATHKRDPETGMMKVVFQDGTSQLTDVKLPPNTEDRDIGGAIQVLDRDTGQVLQTIPKTMTPGEYARLSLAQQQFAYEKSRPRGGGGGKEAKDIWVAGPDGKPMKVRGVSVGGNSYNVGGRVVQAVPSPTGGGDPFGFSGILTGNGNPRYGGR